MGFRLDGSRLSGRNFEGMPAGSKFLAGRQCAELTN